MSEATLTPAQDEAIKKVYDLLGEHFSGSVFAICFQRNGPGGEEDQEAFNFYFTGGHAQAVGLAELTRARLLEGCPP